MTDAATEEATTAPTPPKLHRRSYWVWLYEDDHETVADAILVETTYADQLRGELEIGKQGLNMAAAPMHAATIWVWCAMVRTKLYEDRFITFKNQDLAEMEPIMRPDETPGAAAPDPT